VSGAPRIHLVRRTSFSAAVQEPSSGGRRSRAKGFGYNYRLEAYFEGEIDPLTGMIINLVDIDRWLKELTDQLDHRVLNEVPAFKGVFPTAERVALFCLKDLEERIKAGGQRARVVKVRLYEGDGLWVDAFAT